MYDTNTQGRLLKRKLGSIRIGMDLNLYPDSFSYAISIQSVRVEITILKSQTRFIFAHFDTYG